jgi:hypothetical protein
MITTAQFIQAAKAVGCDTAAIQAVTAVESGKSGFYPSGKIILKFEGHIFHLYTKGKFDLSHPHISYPHWTEQYSQFGEAAYTRFDEAFNLDPHAALFSTSWGMFQIMGENYSACGFRTVDAFVTSLKLGEANQLAAFVAYVKSERLDRFLVALDWDSFARRYNGPLYQKNDYAGQLRRNYLKFKTQL